MTYRIILSVVLVWLSLPLWANESSRGDTDRCRRAARIAADHSGVPLHVLLSIVRIESGKRDAAFGWPWTVNAGGDGRYFPDRRQALDFARRHSALGRTNLDIGCFQLNLYWHGEAFPSLDAMLSPQQNALYAAIFLADLKKEFGTWRSAAGAYHSRTDELAAKYLLRYDVAYASLAPDGPKEAPHTPASPNAATSFASLVPLAPTRTPFLDMQRRMPWR